MVVLLQSKLIKITIKKQTSMLNYKLELFKDLLLFPKMVNQGLIQVLIYL